MVIVSYETITALLNSVRAVCNSGFVEESFLGQSIGAKARGVYVSLNNILYGSQAIGALTGNPYTSQGFILGEDVLKPLREINYYLSTRAD